MNSLPLEFRGSDQVSKFLPDQRIRFHFSYTTQTLRTQIETVIEALMDNPEKAYKGKRVAWPPCSRPWTTTVYSERPCPSARVEPSKSPQVLPGSGQPQDRHQGRLCMCEPRIFSHLVLITWVGIVSLAGPLNLIPLPRSTLPMIAVFHHPPQFRSKHRID